MVKMVILVRKDLKMNKGKIGSQCAHAALGAILKEGSFYEQNGFIGFEINFGKKAKKKKELYDWLHGKFTKVCLAVNSEEELCEIHNLATVNGLTSVLITDAGDTVFNGVPTKTCVAIGPADAEKIDKITGGLKLL